MTHPPTCAVHDRLLICPACAGARGGRATTPAKVAAARENAAVATAARVSARARKRRHATPLDV